MARREVETAAYVAFSRRVIRAAGARAADGDDWDLAEVASLRDDVEAAIARGVEGLREQGHSWAYIGVALGITRQAAQQRYAERKTA